ncbi:MAG: hypothetical protein ACE5EU_11490 [Paracoccaceae bacterium]
MYRSRVSLGSLVASTAMICVLSLTPPVVSPDGGFFTLSLAHAQCCLTAETHVLIADGTERAIAGKRPGDQMFGRGSGVTRVNGMHIRPQGPRTHFGVNQQQPFFTAGHPFPTPGGQRALDRAATRLETSGLNEAELAAGGGLITAAAVSGEAAGAPAPAPAASFEHPLSRLPTPADESLAANTKPVEAGTTANGGSTGTDGTGDAAGDADTAATDSDSGEFTGSATPAGPDLTTSEERELISGGWN